MNTLTENKEIIKNAFQDVLIDINTTEQSIKQYFSEDYIQYVNGKKLTFNEFVKHVFKLKSILSSIEIEFKYIVAENDKVCTVHVAQGIKNNGNLVRTQVNALFQIKKQKIILCDELTHLMTGQESDKDLGSRY
ncbi:MAG: ester cyclase [Gammaproteobacteria bacterium]|nr:ester cyclase [Gammaproteobacteria bacterium]